MIVDEKTWENGAGAPFYGKQHIRHFHLADSDLLAGYTITGSGDPLTVTRTYEDHRNLITAVEHEVDATLISRYTYANNEIGHRTHVVNQGSAFADVGDAMNFYGGRECASTRISYVGCQ